MTKLKLPIEHIEAQPLIPAICYSKNNVTGEYIAIKSQEGGYNETTVYNAAHAQELNKRLGVTEEQRLAMDLGSMFGWDVPGADPRNDMNVQMAKQNRITGEALGL